MTTELKDCPHCGGISEIRYHNDEGELLLDDCIEDATDVDYYSVACCKCGSSSDLKAKLAEVVASWNRRAPLDLEALAAEIDKEVTQFDSGTDYASGNIMGLQIAAAIVRNWGKK